MPDQNANTSDAQDRRLAVAVSGSGRTLQNLLHRIDAGLLRASIVLVIASRECRGADRARERRIPTLVIPDPIPIDALDNLLATHDVNWLVLAGFLKRIPIPPRLRGRVVNIHPALLPKFGGFGMYGHRVHQAVLQAAEKESGCTVHLCDEEYDRGPIVLQRKCPVLPTDTVETLAARVFELEKEAYPEALELLMSGRVGASREEG